MLQEFLCLHDAQDLQRHYELLREQHQCLIRTYRQFHAYFYKILLVPSTLPLKMDLIILLKVFTNM